MKKSLLGSKRATALFFLFLSFSNIILATNADKGITKGQLTDVAGNALPFASIAVRGSSMGTSTNEKGFFTLPLQPGSYTLQFTYTGHETANRSIEIANKHSIIDLGQVVLQESDQLLSEIVVRQQKVAAHIEESDYVARLPLKNMENPQVYITVSDELLKQQVATKLDDALKNVPGAGVPIRFNQNRVVFLSRGFTTQPKFRNGLTSFIQTNIDPVNTERIEVIKGPSATLFGSSVVSYGGLLNRVTKKPGENRLLEVSYLSGSWNLNRLNLDYNHALTDDKSVLFRMNSAVHRENSFQDAGFSNSFTFTPSALFKLSEKVKLLVDVEYGQNKGTSPIRFSPWTNSSGTRNIASMGMDYNRSFASNDVFYNASAFNIFLNNDIEISENWKSQTAVSRTSSGFDGYTSQLQGRSDTTLRAQVTIGAYNYNSTNIQQNFIGSFKWLNFSHRIVLGLDYYNYSSNRNTANVYSATVDFRKSLDDYYATYNRAYLDAEAAAAKLRMEKVEQDTYSSYISDAVNLNDRLSILLSLRLDHFRNHGTDNLITGSNSGKYHQTALSPKLGIVYQLLQERLSLFSNYMNGFSNQNGSDKEGNSFKPENAIQYEGGLKADLWNKRLSGSLSYYHILVKDVLRDDPTDTDYSIQDGEQLSQGVELQLSAQITKGLSLLVGYAYNDSKYLKADETIEGLRPASTGSPTTLNWWLNYNFNEGSLKGFNLGLGGNYGSSSYQTNTQTAQVIIPSYLTLDASVGWQTEHFHIAVKVDNLSNERYWSYRLAPQNPRRFTGTIAYRF